MLLEAYQGGGYPPIATSLKTQAVCWSACPIFFAELAHWGLGVGLGGGVLGGAGCGCRGAEGE
jgi:hypothetical protein